MSDASRARLRAQLAVVARWLVAPLAEDGTEALASEPEAAVAAGVTSGGMQAAAEAVAAGATGGGMQAVAEASASEPDAAVAAHHEAAAPVVQPFTPTTPARAAASSQSFGATPVAAPITPPVWGPVTLRARRVRTEAHRSVRPASAEHTPLAGRSQSPPHVEPPDASMPAANGRDQGSPPGAVVAPAAPAPAAAVTRPAPQPAPPPAQARSHTATRSAPGPTASSPDDPVARPAQPAPARWIPRPALAAPARWAAWPATPSARRAPLRTPAGSAPATSPALTAAAHAGALPRASDVPALSIPTALPKPEIDVDTLEEALADRLEMAALDLGVELP